MAKCYQVQNHDEQLINTWFSGPKKNPKELVIHTHGLGGFAHSRHNQVICKTYRRAGHPVLMVDVRCSNSNKSYGELDDYTMDGHIKDIQTILNWVSEQKPEWVNNKPIILSGHSMGGYAVLSVAANWINDEDMKIGKIITFSPVVSGKLLIDTFDPERKEQMKAGTYIEPQEAETGGTGKSDKLTDKNWTEWQKHDARKFAQKINIPVTIIQMEKDALILPEHTQKLYSVLPNADYKVLEDACHNFRDKNDVVLANKLEEVIYAALRVT